MTDTPKPSAIQQYEFQKAQVRNKELTPKEYERLMKSIARSLGV